MAKPYNLEERTEEFARDVRAFVRELILDMANKEDARQLIKSSGSIGAKYIEANEKLGDKDFLFRLKIARKEAKESAFWLRLINTMDNQILEKKRQNLMQESQELRRILSAIISKSKN